MSLSLVSVLLASASPVALPPTLLTEPAPPIGVPVQQQEGPPERVRLPVPAPAPAPEQEQVPPNEPLPAEPLAADQAQDAAVATPDADPADPDAADSVNTIIVSGETIETPGDPLENINAQTYELVQQVDSVLVGPLAEAYEDGLPKPARNGLRNFLRNLLEPVNFLNFLLQLKPGKAFETLGRFAINTTLGVGGLFDIAAQEPFYLPYRRNGLANTLGYYGVGTGPFLVLPLVGATTLRDLFGNTIDQLVVPYAVGAPLDTPYYAIPAYTVNSLQFRMEMDERIEQINDSVDPYFAMRESYLCLREADIAALHNRPPPRDCSIDALMADPELVEEYALDPGEADPEEVVDVPEGEAAAPDEVEDVPEWDDSESEAETVAESDAAIDTGIDGEIGAEAELTTPEEETPQPQAPPQTLPQPE